MAVEIGATIENVVLEQLPKKPLSIELSYMQFSFLF